MEHWELILFFFGIAVLYATVGFGGGSSYLAILALYSLDFQLLRATALLCNITVVTGGTYIFYRSGYLKLKKIWPIILFSVPMAFVGGSLRIQETTFFIMLGIVLLIAATLLWLQPENNSADEPEKYHKPRYGANAALGGGIGFLAGMVGIGGGIFLAPLLHLMRWDKAKTIAATASAFILVNSISGLLGQLSQPAFTPDWPLMLLLIASVLAGGQIGSRMGARRFSPVIVKKLTAILIIFVSIRILYKYIPLWLG